MSLVDELRERIRDLEEENALLKREAFQEGRKIAELSFGGRLGVTKAQTTVLLVLVSRPLASREAIYNALYAGRYDEAPDPKIIDVYVLKVRRQLKKLGINIRNQWGTGWSIKDEDRAWLCDLRDRAARGESIDEQITARGLAPPPESLEQRVLKLLRQKKAAGLPMPSYREMAWALDAYEHGVMRVVHSLADAGLVKRPRGRGHPSINRVQLVEQR